MLIGAGYSVFLCDQMNPGEDYRDEISLYVDSPHPLCSLLFTFFFGTRHAAKCTAFIAFINLPWCQSWECSYEFKIAVRNNLVNKGRPQLIPILLESFSVYQEYDPLYFPPFVYPYILLSLKLPNFKWSALQYQWHIRKTTRS